MTERLRLLDDAQTFEGLRRLRHTLDELDDVVAVSYTHLRAPETVLDLVCRLLLAKNTHIQRHSHFARNNIQTTNTHDTATIVHRYTH